MGTMMVILLGLALGITGLTSLVLVPALLKIAKQLRNKEKHLNDGGVVIVYLFIIGLSVSVAIGLYRSFIISIALVITGILAPFSSLELLKQICNGEELNKGNKVFLCAYGICLGIALVIGIWTYWLQYQYALG